MANKFLVIDTETGGLDPLTHSILSVGAVVYRPGQISAQTEIIVMEQHLHLQPEAMVVNRINLVEHRKAGVLPSVAIEQLEDFLAPHFGPTEKIALAGHNVSFDIGFLKRLYRLGGQDFERRFSHRALDTASVLAFLRLAGRLNIPNAGLDAALKYFQIPVSEATRHTALIDAIATAKLIDKLLGFIDGNLKP